MKSLILLLLGISSMMYQDFENLLGRQISEVSNLGVISKSLNNNAFWASDSESDFLGRSYDRVYITTDKNEVIEEITIYFSGILDRSFYDIITDEYGNADRILVPDSIEKGEKEIVDGQELQESFISFREGDFDESPFYLYWDKSDYQIRIFLDYNNQISTVLYRKPTKRL